MNDFLPFQKIPRLNRDIVITEKIDGTNGQIYIVPDHHEDLDVAMAVTSVDSEHHGELLVYAGSRNRWVLPGNDNFAFAGWVRDNAADLVRILGPGRHFGEWWGKGIQRGYGINGRVFSLFNVHKWGWLDSVNSREEHRVPDSLAVTPTLYRGPWVIPYSGARAVDWIVASLTDDGSEAAPGFMDPEGVVIFHEASGHLYKVTCKDDEKPKGGNK